MFFPASILEFLSGNLYSIPNIILCIVHHFICCFVSSFCMFYLFAVQYPNQGEDHHRPCLLSNPLIHMYVLCMYVCYHEISNKQININKHMYLF